MSNTTATLPNSGTVTRLPRSAAILWTWTGVSALLHAVLIGALCGISYMSFAKREGKAKEKQAQEEAAAAKASKDEAAKNANTAPAAGAPVAPTNPGTASAPTSTPAATSAAPPKIATGTPPEPPAPATNPQQQAEKILGIDQTAKPGEIPKSPFAGKEDDLLKDLK